MASSKEASKDAILFLGVAGWGKSSIIAKATGEDVPIGHGCEYCTKTSTGWNFTGENDRSVMLIDSPGFSHLGMSDSEGFHSMTQFLEAHPHLRVIAMVYLHPISEKRFFAPDRLFLKIFQHLCGEHYYPNVVVVTTMWNDATVLTRPAYEAREKELCESQHIWRDMLTKGASYFRYDDTGESSKNIIEACFRKSGPDPPHFVSELQKGVTSDDIILPIISRATRRPSVPLDAAGQAEVEEEVQKLIYLFDLEDKIYLEKGAIKAGNGRLEYEPKGW